MRFMPNPDPTIQLLQQQCFPNLSVLFLCLFMSLHEAWPQFPALGRQERHLARSSAADAHLLQGVVLFKDALPHAFVVTSGYLNSASGHSPLTSGINKGLFAPKNKILSLSESFL